MKFFFFFFFFFSNYNYLPGGKSGGGASVSKSGTAISLSSGTSVGVSIFDIICLLTRQMQKYSLPMDIR